MTNTNTTNNNNAFTHEYLIEMLALNFYVATAANGQKAYFSKKDNSFLMFMWEVGQILQHDQGLE